ncbi:predicted protein [Chaetomium globosum CBS 148.51]|uniref:Uncharacterized protein n=1 Tax=Chaetomium globosum (strain ATCC 6205 / CBS 148.51 / DSM 1962 / NBRC 6347 / NRRL 1970) TaxID=306901 RepID=Q2H312_CHAGB|nr:uncharacterized protein CHGG_03834 [Chaetomium globosum CBS 148.51]EAQ87215.1 predicted protein [Chaetomium globosum CBS 148.51]
MDRWKGLARQLTCARAWLSVGSASSRGGPDSKTVLHEPGQGQDQAVIE